MTTLAFALGTVIVVVSVRWCMNTTQARTDARMLANVAAIKAAHEYQLRLRSRAPAGSDQTGDAGSPQQASPRAGVEHDPPSVVAPPAHPNLVGAGPIPDAAPTKPGLGVSPPAPAGTDTANPRPSPPCARRAQTPAGAGRPPHWHTPAPAGPHTVTP